ncbi:hypothetical protein F4678DRAFT_105570 [Xylaria arbuscula]|nr:hypothetical protein F4678DRAFT_105570 [Xylaria arbuscula]
MRICVAGRTGVVGNAVVRRAMVNPMFTRIIVLSRRPLPGDIELHPKVRIILHEDFGVWPNRVLNALVGCRACIWTIGGKASKFPDLATAWRVGSEYVLYTVDAFNSALGNVQPPGHKFQFVFVSQGYRQHRFRPSVRLSSTRLIKNDVERRLREFQKAHPNTIDIKIARPCKVIKVEDGALRVMLRKVFGGIHEERLARSLLNLARGGFADQYFEEDELDGIGKYDVV